MAKSASSSSAADSRERVSSRPCSPKAAPTHSRSMCSRPKAMARTTASTCPSSSTAAPLRLTSCTPWGLKFISPGAPRRCSETASSAALSVYALGECAQWRASTHGSSQQITGQAEVIAGHLVNRHSGRRYLGVRSPFKYEVAGLELYTMGPPESADGDDVALLFGPGRARYKKVVVRHGRLVSAILIGDLRQASSLGRLFRRHPPHRRGAKPAVRSVRAVRGMKHSVWAPRLA